jgi:hypothetical protein
MPTTLEAQVLSRSQVNSGVVNVYADTAPYILHICKSLQTYIPEDAMR